MITRVRTSPHAAMLSFLAAGLFLTSCSSPEAKSAPAAQPAVSAPQPAPVQAEPTVAVRQTYEIVRQTPHDTAAFTQGLFFDEGVLFESTGHYGESQLRKLDLDTGDVLASRDLPAAVFGEGSALWKDQMIVLTWRSGTGFVADLDTLETVRSFSYPGEGWGLTANDTQLIQSNGSDQLLFLDPETFKVTKRVRVTLNGNPVRNLNELEWIDGEVWANVWQADQIVRIDPESGHVLGVIDFTNLFPASERAVPLDDVLNGIAYDAETERIFITGKRWPSLFEVRIIDQ